MDDQEYKRVKDRLEQYIPFLENMIAQLKDPSRKNRVQQLAKMESLYGMITDKRKKLKYETLVKCEDVISKLYDKVHPNQQVKQNLSTNSTSVSSYSTNKSNRCSPSRTRQSIPATVVANLPEIRSNTSFIDILPTPASPTPERQVFTDKPVLIPTEKVLRNDCSIEPETVSSKPKVDIYRRAAETLHQPVQRESVFNRLGYRLPDMSQPPISYEDLKSLENEESIDLRNKLRPKSASPKVNLQSINTTVRNNTTPVKRQPSFSSDRSRYKIDNRPINKDFFDIEGKPKRDPSESKKKTKNAFDIEGKSKKELCQIESQLKKELYELGQKAEKLKSHPETKLITQLSDLSKPVTDEKSDVSQIAQSPKVTSPHIEKIIKDTDSIFGNLLSSLDNRIRENKKREKKDDRKVSANSKDDQKYSIDKNTGDKNYVTENILKAEVPNIKGEDKHASRKESHGSSNDKYRNIEKEKDGEKHKSKSHKHKHKSKDKVEKEKAKYDKHKHKSASEKQKNKSVKYNKPLDISEKSIKKTLLQNSVKSEVKLEATLQIKNGDTSEEKVEVAEKACSEEKVKVAEKACSEEKVKVAEKTCNEEKVRVAEKARSEEKVKVAEKACSEEKVKVAEKPCNEEKVKVAEKASSEKKVKVAEKACSERIPLLRDTQIDMRSQNSEVDRNKNISQMEAAPIVETIKNEITYVPFRRLADKYNPKPKKATNIGDVDKNVTASIEESMKSLPPKIPFLEDAPKKSDFEPLPSPFPPGFNPVEKMGTTISNGNIIDSILSNPKNSAIIDEVVSKLTYGKSTITTVHNIEPQLNLTTNINIDIRASKDVPMYNRNLSLPKKEPLLPTPQTFHQNDTNSTGPLANFLSVSTLPLASAPILSPNFDKPCYITQAKPHFSNLCTPQQGMNKNFEEDFQSQNAYQQNFTAPRSFNPFDVQEPLAVLHNQTFVANTYNFTQPQAPYHQNAGSVTPNPYNAPSMPANPFPVAQSNAYSGTYNVSATSKSYVEERLLPATSNMYDTHPQYHNARGDELLCQNRRLSDDFVGFSNDAEKRYIDQDKRWPSLETKDPRLARDPRNRDLQESRNPRDPRNIQTFSQDHSRGFNFDMRNEYNRDFRGGATRDNGQDMWESNRNIKRDPREIPRIRDSSRDIRDRDLRDRDPRDRDPRDRDPRDRDPRDRDPRDRDPRDRDPRDRDGREYNRDLENNRDPRTFRRDPRDSGYDRTTRDRDGTFDTARELDNNHGSKRQSRSRERFKSVREQNRYSDKGDSYLERRNRSRSRKRNHPEETFLSPLDSLYHSTESIPKTGKGYGFQAYKIKKEKEGETHVDEKKDKETEKKSCANKNDTIDKIEIHPKMDLPIEVDKEDTIKSEQDACVHITAEKHEVHDEGASRERLNEASDTMKTDHVVSQDRVEEVELSTSTDNLVITNEDKSNLKSECYIQMQSGKKEHITYSNDAIEINKSDVSIKTSQKFEDTGDTKKTKGERIREEKEKIESVAKPLKDSSDQSILAQFFANLLGSQNKKDKKGAILSLITTFADNFSDQQLKKISHILENSSDEEDSFASKEDDIPLSELKKSREISKKAVADQKCQELKSSKKCETKSKLAKPKNSSDNEQVAECEETPSLNTVVVSVGERIKSRKRKPQAVQIAQPKHRKRTELDMLHEDIKDMFIRDGVLTATGKRMCNILSGDSSDAEKKDKLSKGKEEEVPKRKTRNSVKSEKNDDEEDINVMKNVRVILPKIDISSKNDRYSLRQISNRPSYVEPENMSNEHSTISVHIIDKDTHTGTNKLSGTGKSLSTDLIQNMEENLTSEDQKPQKNNKKRKVKSGWATGVIKKKKRKSSLSQDDKPIVHSEETDNDTESRNELPPKGSNSIDVKDISKEAMKISTDTEQKEMCCEPDIDYYYQHKKVTNCKLCTFKGKSLSAHYRTSHPSSEVLISRLDPLKAQQALEISKENDHDSIKQEVNKNQQLRMNYCCVFCNLELKNALALQFYDHVTLHTGEFRYSCKECNFVCNNRKKLSKHSEFQHNISGQKRSRFRNPNLPPILYGYMCVVCNYVQLDSERLQSHMKLCHSGHNDKVAIINLSTFKLDEVNSELVLKAAIEDKDTKNCEESSEYRVSETNSPVAEVLADGSGAHSNQIDSTDETDKSVGGNSKKMRSPKSKQKSSRIKDSEDQEEKITTKANEPYPSEEKSKNPSNSPIKDTHNVESCLTDANQEVTNKQVDLNVFTCATDIYEEEQKIEAERLRKMQEISKSVKINRNSLDFIQKLSCKLTNTTNESVVETASLKTEPVEEAQLEPCEVKVFDKSKSASEPNEKPGNIMDILRNTEAQQKNNHMIDTMVQKLQGILQTESKQIEASGFSSFTETNVSEEIDSLPPLIPLKTLNLKPSDDAALVLDTGLIKVIMSSNAITYSCLVPPCIFTAEDQNVFSEHCKVAHMWLSYVCDKCEACGKTVNSKNARPRLFDLFEHILKNHADFVTLKPAQNRKPLLRARRLSGDKLSVRADEKRQSESPKSVHNLCVPNKNIETDSSIEDLPLLDQNDGEDESCIEDNPFGFKIADVISLADLNGPPKLLPLSNQAEISSSQSSPQTKISIQLCEVEMTGSELSGPRKTREAMSKFLTCSKDLYKCPVYSCKFTSNYADMYTKHVNIHTLPSNTLVPCVYCDWKTPLQHSGRHIEVRHGNCNYACPFCMYRAVKREFVALHLEDKHKSKSRYWSIINLPQHKNQKKLLILTKPSPRYCKPYSCSCGNQYLFQMEFSRHLKACTSQPHKCVYEPCKTDGLVFSDYLQHIIQVHSIYAFQCSYCPACFSSALLALQHHAVRHPTLVEYIYSRREPTTKGDYGYTETAFKYLHVMKTDAYPRLSTVPSTDDNMPKLQSFSKIVSSASCESKNSNDIESLIIPDALVQNQPEPRILNFDIHFNKQFDLNRISSQNKSNAVPPIIEKDPLDITDEMAADTIEVPSENDASDLTNIVGAVIPSTSVINEETLRPSHISTGDTSVSPIEPKITRKIIDSPIMDAKRVRRSTSISGEDSDSRETDSADDMSLKKTGLVGTLLYKCGACEQGFQNACLFKDHVTSSVICRSSTTSTKPYMCTHCGRHFRNANGLMTHIQYHGNLRFRCSLCNEKFAHGSQGKLHMKSRHSIPNITNVPLSPGKSDIEMDEFVMKPKTHRTEQPKMKEPLTEEATAPSLTKTSFLPSEVNQLPIRSIYSTQVRCAVCLYGTKVRTNLIRHLQLHVEEKSVSNSAPVNPVPCLDKNEKMFDKMTNLAISSFSSGSSRMGGTKVEGKGDKEVSEDYPAYVPPHRRFVCGANDCNYLCLEENNLRHHLLALHDEETSFTCTHCKKQLVTDADGVLKHLKLHDLHLYKCSHCSFIHNLRHKIERHLIDHNESNVKIITLRALDAPPPLETENQQDILQQEQTVTMSTFSKWSKPWRCSMCKHRTATKEDIVTHVLNKHEIDSQFKCTLCTFKTNDDTTFPGHFKDNHPGHEIDIIMVFHETNEEKNINSDNDFDTTPLWLRDKPRVRHIRGILLDEVSPISKKKTIGKFAPTPPLTITSPGSSVDSAIDAVVKGTAHVMKQPQTSSGDDIFEKINQSLEASKEDIILAKQEQVISISDSDDDDLIILDQPSITDDEKSEAIDVETISREHSQLFTIFTKKDELIVEYGALGLPLNMQFSCPRCNKFKTKKIIDFIHHLFRDLNYKRYECMHCHLRSVTKNYVLNHIKKHDTPKNTGLRILPVNMDIYWWVEMVIRHQSSIIASQNPVPVPVQENVNISGNECRFCCGRYSNSIDTHLHEVRHWMEYSLHCNLCPFKCDMEDEMKHHLTTHHSNLATDFKQDLAPTVLKYIEMCEDGSKVTIELPKIDQLFSTPTRSDSGIHFYCLYCYWKGDSSDDVKNHWVEKHQAAGLEFKVKKSRTVDNTLLACEYCNAKGLENELKNHHELTHPQDEFRVYKFKCPLCSQMFRRIDYFRTHVKKVHNQQYLHYVNIYGENVKQDSSVSYKCPVCKHTSPSTSAFRSHVRMHCRPVQCKMCSSTFKHRHDAVQHFQKDHPHSPVSLDLLKDKIKEYDDICYKVLGIRSSMKLIEEVHSEQSSSYCPVTTHIKAKNCARKSTAAVRRPELEYSYYGCAIEPTDMKTIITTIEMNKSEVTMTAHQLNSFFNLSPRVVVEDCLRTGEQSSIDELDL